MRAFKKLFTVMIIGAQISPCFAMSTPQIDPLLAPVYSNARNATWPAPKIADPNPLSEADRSTLETIRTKAKDKTLSLEDILTVRALLARDHESHSMNIRAADRSLYFEELGLTAESQQNPTLLQQANEAVRAYESHRQFLPSSAETGVSQVLTLLNPVNNPELHRLPQNDQKILEWVRDSIETAERILSYGPRTLGQPAPADFGANMDGYDYSKLLQGRYFLDHFYPQLEDITTKLGLDKHTGERVTQVALAARDLLLNDINVARFGRTSGGRNLEQLVEDIAFRMTQHLDRLRANLPEVKSKRGDFDLAEALKAPEVPTPRVKPREVQPVATAPAPLAATPTPAAASPRPVYKHPAFIGTGIGLTAIAGSAAIYYSAKHLKKSHESKNAQGAR